MQRHKPDFILLATTLCLLAYGLVMVFSASMVWAIQVSLASPSYYFVHQLESACIGVVGMLILMNVPYHRFRKMAKWITFGTVGALMLVLIPHIGFKAQGVRRWIGPPALHFQPSEFALVGILFYLAYIYDKNEGRTLQFKRGVLPPLIMLGLQFVLVLLEPDMGTGMLLLLSGLAVMFAAGIRWRHIVTIGLCTLPVVFAFARFESYRNKRLAVFGHTWNPAYKGQGVYQLQQALIAIHHGGWFGQGLGRGISPFLYLPIPYADFIFAVIVEELGLVGAGLLLLLFAVLIWRGIRVSQRLSDRFSSLLAVGIVSLIGFGVIINVGAVTGLMPITGIPLPFVSYGGTSLLVKLLAMGVLLSLSRYTSDPHPAAAAVPDGKVRALLPAAVARSPVPGEGGGKKRRTARQRSAPALSRNAVRLK